MSRGLDGALVLDKPAGLTSHDVVAAARRRLRERRIGHTGTLDPMATGVLVLLVGRATRLARFLGSDRKRYDALVRFGWRTDTDDATGAPLGEPIAAAPDPSVLAAALDRFRGDFLQRPPGYSAKKVAGRRAYALARRDAAPELAPVCVSIYALEAELAGADTLRLSLECSAGFYVRALARDLGDAAGTGAHLASLRRTASGAFTLADALTLEALLEVEDPSAALRPLDRLAPHLPAIALEPGMAARIGHGLPVPAPGIVPPGSPVRLLDAAGRLIAVATPDEEGRVLRPTVVLM